MYEVKNGVIVTPGEFYLEREYIPHFVEKVQGRHANYRERDSNGDMWDVCQVHADDVAKFPSLQGIQTVAVRYEENPGCWLSWIRTCWYRKT